MFKRSKGATELADTLWFTTGVPNKILESLNKLVNWSPIRAEIAKAYAPKHQGGKPGFDPIVLLKLLLLEHWYNLSDGRVLEEAADRLSFRRFLEIGVGDDLPDDTTLVKFRSRLRESDILDDVLQYVNACIANQGFTLRTGAIVDATLVKAAIRPRSDGSEKELEPDADKTVKNGNPHYGYKAHVATDVETNVIKSVEVTPASHHDTTVFEELIDEDEPVVYADKAYASQSRRRWLRAKKIKDKILRKASRSRALTWIEKTFNKKASKIRSSIERKFAEIKQWHGFDRMRYRGIANARLQTQLVAIVVNLKFLALRCG